MCKNTPIIPDRNGSVKRPEKFSKSFHRQCVTDCENSTVNEVTSNGNPKVGVWFQNVEKRHAGSWQKNDIETVAKLMQVRPGDQPGYPKDTIESFVGHSSIGLLCPPDINVKLKGRKSSRK